MAGEAKLGAYICKGCGLGERLDCAELAKVAQKEGKAQIVREHDFLCHADGLAMIEKDIAEGVNQIAIAACSRRAKAEAFAFDGVAITRANLREGVIWVQPDNDEAREATQEAAADYVRMVCAEARAMRVPVGNPDRGGNKRVLVVGGGISGLTAAREVANAGYEVLLVEKSEELGGMARHLFKRVPKQEPFSAPQETGLTELIDSVRNDSRITIFVSSTIAETSGAPGRFQVEIASADGNSRSETVGAIIQASGFTPYEPSGLTEFSYGKTPDVVDQLGLEKLARAANGGPITRPSDGKPVRSVAFVQCAGQRSYAEGRLPYCSGHCCNTSIKQAMYFKDVDPSIDTAVIYTDLRTPGNGEDFYRSAQNKGVTFTKGTVSAVTATDGGLKIDFKDLILDQDVTLQADLVVLATGQVPNSGIDIELSEEIQAAAADKSVLNLTYRQGKDLPQLRYGFTDSHFICFPYETRRTGIYACGPVRRPMDIAQAMDDATGAALKAIQAVENAAAGRAAHPRAGDLSFPQYRREGCTQCKRCTVECPFGAIDEDEKRYPVFNESRCRRCGTCMGACPVRVISFENYSIDTVGAQIKAVDIPDEFSEKPRILILACENDAYPALDMAGMNNQHYSAFVRIIPVRCLGSVNTIWITDALNGGYDTVALMGCKHGIDYQCHFVKGSELATYRASKIDDTLKQLGLEPERVQLFEVAITDSLRVPKLIQGLVDKVNEIGMSPLKF